MCVSIIAIIGILVYLFLPINCPKSINESKNKSESIDTVLVIDGSGSMDDKTNAGEGVEMTKYQAAAKASTEIISMIQQEKKTQDLKSKVGMVQFSGSADTSLPLNEDFTDVKEFFSSGSSYSWGWGGTNLGSGIEEALELFSKSDNKNKVMVVLSDGRSNTGISNDEILSDLIPKANKMGVKIYTIGFDQDESKKTTASQDVDPVFLYQIAKKTEGKFYYAQKLLDLVFAFSDLYHQATGDVIASIKGQIKNGQYKSAKINVPCDCGNLRITVNSSSKSKIKINLINSMNNSVISQTSRYKIVEENGFTNVTYNSPMSGEWQIELYGKDIKDSNTDFYLSASVANKKAGSNTFNYWLADRFWYLIAIIGLIFVFIFTFLFYRFSFVKSKITNTL